MQKIITSLTLFDFLAYQSKKKDQKCFISHTDGRQNVQQSSNASSSVSICNIKSIQVTKSEKKVKKGIFRILTAVEMRKKLCSKNFFELKSSGKVKSVEKSLHMKFENIWNILT